MPAFLLLAIAAGCAGGGADTAASEDLLATLTAPGPYAVGYAESAVTYPDPAGGGDRSLRLALWVPTDDDDGDEAAYFLGSIPAEGVLDDAAPAAGPFPLAVFSHGTTGYAENSAFLMEHLASHGYIVAAADHTDDTILDGGDRATEIYFQRAHDVSALIDHVQGLGLPLDGDVVALGHSFGGYTLHGLAGAAYDEALIADCLSGADTSSYCSTMTDAWADLFRAGFSDDRVRAWVSMAPGDYRLYGAGLAEAAGPFLHMTGELYPRTGTDNEDIWAGLQGGESLRVQILGGGHQTFTDYSGVLESFDGLIEAQAGFDIINPYALAFLDYHRGDDRGAPLLGGDVVVSAQATLMR